MLQAARLNDLVILQLAQEGKDSFGGTTSAWVQLAQVYADIQPIRGKEFFDSFQVQVEVSYKIKIRYRADVVPKMRVLFGTRIFSIEYVIDVGERHETLELMCAEGPKEE